MARKSNKRQIAIKNGYKSGFEYDTALQLESKKIKFTYESGKVHFIVPEKKRTYTPDFFLPNGVIIETKGRWTLEDRKKHLLIKAQNPKLDIRIVFQNENQKIRKGSKTSYADFCRKHEIMFASKEIPEDWLR
tara:strand:+ start:370 stop:768 length:399 start_codon:yes stop_codon:yes gene_type:complete